MEVVVFVPDSHHVSSPPGSTGLDPPLSCPGPSTRKNLVRDGDAETRGSDGNFVR